MSSNGALCVIGGGNMAQAIVRGGLDAGVLEGASLVVAEPDEAKRGLWAGWGVRAVAGAGEAMDAAGGGQVMLAVKPQMFGDVAAALGGRVDGVVMSIMAGVSSVGIRSALGDGARVVRLMPNTPARVRKGITAMALGAGARAGDDALARALFEAVGEVVDLEEALMDAFTAIAGSGPAYVFYLAEAMVRGGVGVDLAPEVADRVVRATIAGAAALLEASDDVPEALRAAVTSKGGTTAAAIGEFDSRGVMDAVVDAVRAARDRGRELGA